MIVLEEPIYQPGRGDVMTKVMTIDYDPSRYTTAEAAARAFHSALVTAMANSGVYCDDDPDIETYLFAPERAVDYSGDKHWCVVWESGPYEWAIGASWQVRGPWGHTEPYYSFDLHFYDES